MEDWTKKAEAALVGRTIVSVRYLHAAEVQSHGWRRASLALFLDDGTIIYPSADDEGNDAGTLFGVRAEGEELTFPRQLAR